MSGSPASQRRRAFIERIERLEEERKTLADDIASVYDELKADGHDKAAVKIIVKIRRKEDGLAKWVGYSGTVDEYLADLGMLPKLEEARAGARVRENIEEIGAEINRQIASGEIVAVAQTGELTDTQEQPETTNAIHERPSINAEAYPEAGPQAEASPAGIGTGMLAGHEGRSEGEAASADLPTYSPSPASAPRPAIADDEAAQANPIVVGNSSNPQPSSLGAVMAPEADSLPASGAALSEDGLDPSKLTFLTQGETKRKTAADYRGDDCQHPDACGSTDPFGLCYTCRRAMEAASETEAAA